MAGGFAGGITEVLSGKKNLAKGIKVETKEGQLIVLQGKTLDPKAPVKIEIKGILKSPLDFLKKRVPTLTIEKCQLLVNSQKMEIELILNETDGFEKGSVLGKVEINPDFIHPELNKSISQLHDELENPEMVFLYGTRIDETL